MDWTEVPTQYFPAFTFILHLFPHTRYNHILQVDLTHHWKRNRKCNRMPNLWPFKVLGNPWMAPPGGPKFFSPHPPHQMLVFKQQIHSSKNNGAETATTKNLQSSVIWCFFDSPERGHWKVFCKAANWNIQQLKKFLQFSSVRIQTLPK